MAVTDFYLGDYGINIELDCTQEGVDFDISDATLELILTKPSGEELSKTPVVTTPTNVAVYCIEDGVLDEDGRWRGKLTAEGVLDTVPYHLTAKFSFLVEE